MSNNRYVILNCPTLMGNRLCYGKTIKQCADCDDCVVKQIAIMCNYAIHGAKATGHFNFLGEKILKLLDIQEVE